MSLFNGLKVHTVTEMKAMRNVVQLTKWLQGERSEIEFLYREYKRIASDPIRKCYIVNKHYLYALFVNDMTEGAWKAMRDEDD